MRMIELARMAKIPIELNREGVSEVAIMTDTGREPEIAQALAVAAYGLGLEPTIVTMVERPVHGLEPTSVIAHAALGAQLLLFATSTGMAHTECVRNALKAGKKYIGMPGITIETMINGAATADYEEVGRITAAVARVITEGSDVRITTDFGTDLRFSIKNRRGLELAGVFKPPSIGCFPDGEAPTAPVDGSANGTLVVDSTIHQVGRIKTPVVMTVKDGFVTHIEGQAEAEALKSILARHGDPNSFHIGEFAVGTNPRARISDNVSEDKKRLGSIHLAMGDNVTLGGHTPSCTHIDCILGYPNLWIDDTPIIEQGQLKIAY